MEWIEKGIKERAQKAERSRLIEISVSDLWTNLAAAVKDCIKAYQSEAERLGQTLKSNGQAYVTIVIRRESSRAHSGEQGGIITATLVRENPDITVKYEGQPAAPTLKLTVDVFEGIASLVHEGKPASAERAAELILRPFLFSDLEPR